MNRSNSMRLTALAVMMATTPLITPTYGKPRSFFDTPSQPPKDGWYRDLEKKKKAPRKLKK